MDSFCSNFVKFLLNSFMTMNTAVDMVSFVDLKVCPLTFCRVMLPQIKSGGLVNVGITKTQ